MAKIDYHEIAEQIKIKIHDYDDLSSVTVTVEEEIPLDSGPWVAIYLGSRRAHESQPMAAGTKTRYYVTYHIWCHQYSLTSVAEANQLRDDLVGEVEIALMSDRTLNNKVSYAFLDGGRFQSGRLTKPDGSEIPGAVASGEIILVVDVTAST